MDLLSESESDREVKSLKINKAFAKTFEEKERLKELEKAKYLSSDESESDSETEDEDAEQLSADINLKVVQTINSIRKKDPKIYDRSTKWFDNGGGDDDESEDSDESVSDSHHRKKTYKDVVREQILDESGQSQSESEGEHRKSSTSRDKKSLIYDREQSALRDAFLKSVQEADSGRRGQLVDMETETGGDDFLTVKKKSKRELEAEKLELDQALEEMKKLSNQTDNDKFLADYISQRKWVDAMGTSVRDDELSDYDKEEDELDREDLFESQYNFRFEEIEQTSGKSGLSGSVRGSGLVGLQVQGHSRNVDGTVRRVDDKRKVQRLLREERKSHERRQKEEELKRLKNLKKEELRKRLLKIGEVGGLKSLGLDESALDEEWDPDKHEAMMRAQFNDDYYDEEDADFIIPKADDMDDIDDPVLRDVDAEEEDLEGDDGYIETATNPHVGDTRSSILDELYQLDYEDIIDGMPCRFKYRQVQPENFGLDVEEILLADDAELNQYVSLRKLAPYAKNSRGTDAGDNHKLSKKRKKLRLLIRERLEKEATEAAAAGKQLKGTQPAIATSVTAPITEEVSGKRKRKRRKDSKVAPVNSSSSVVNFEALHSLPSTTAGPTPEILEKRKKLKKDKSGGDTTVEIQKKRMNLLR